MHIYGSSTLVDALLFDRGIDVKETFSLPRVGMYLVQLFENGQPTSTQQLIVQ